MRTLMQIPKDQKIADENGNITPEWARVLEAVCDFAQKAADAIDAAEGDSSGATVDAEWNAFVNANRQE